MRVDRVIPLDALVEAMEDGARRAGQTELPLVVEEHYHGGKPNWQVHAVGWARTIAGDWHLLADPEATERAFGELLVEEAFPGKDVKLVLILHNVTSDV